MEQIAMTTRLSVNISDDVAAVLRELAEKDEETVTEIIRRAVSVYHFFDTARSEGKTIQLVDKRGNITELKWAD